MISKETAEHYRWGEACDGWHLVKSQTLSVIQELVPPGCSEVQHYHERSEKFFFVLSGIATLNVNGVSHQLMPQQLTLTLTLSEKELTFPVFFEQKPEKWFSFYGDDKS